MRTQDSQVACAIKEQTKVLAELLHAFKDESKFWRSRHGLATKDDLKQLGELLMGKWQEFGDAVEAHLDSQSTKIDVLTTAAEEGNAAVTGLTGDIAELKRLIEASQESPDDQALRDRITQKMESMSAKTTTAADNVAAVVKAAKELDEMTPPTPPSP